MSDNKPPMTLYFRENISTVHMDGSHMDNRFGQAFANRKRESDVGPYIHLKQFMEEVERQADAKHATTMRDYGSDFFDAFWQLARETWREKCEN